MNSPSLYRGWLIVLGLGLVGCYSLPAPQTPPGFQVNEEALTLRTNKDFFRKDPQGPLTLREALLLTLHKNPRLEAYSWKIRQREAQLLQASLFPNPKLEGEIEEFGGEGNRQGFDGAEGALVVSQVLPWSGRIAYRTQVAAHKRDLALWDYEKTRLDVFTSLNKAFIEVLTAQEHLKVSKKILTLSQKVHGAVQARVKAGKVSPLEEKKASIVLENSRLDHHRAQLHLQRARRTLALFWNQEKPQFQKVIGNLFNSSPLPPPERNVPQSESKSRSGKIQSPSGPPESHD